VNVGWVLVLLCLAAGDPGADRHLLAGADLFREGRFAEALVEFRVAERLGDAEARRYAGVALVKLGRYEEAIDALGDPDRGEDPLMGWYRALAHEGAGLDASADALLGALGARAGPKVSEQAARLRADLARRLAAVPERDEVDAALSRCAAVRLTDRPVLAAAVCREAAARAARRKDGYRLAEANAAGAARVEAP